MYTFRYRILYFCLLVFSAHAQTPFISDKSLVASNDFTIENWNSENGLPQNSVISMLQTRDGFLWLSTTNGLLRFDGKTFRNFNTSNTPGLQGTSFPVLFESRQGILWVINLSGKLFHYEEGEFQEVVFKGQEQAGFKSLCENKTGNLIACIGSNQVYEYAGGVFKPLLTLPVKTGNISQICCDGDELYLSTERRLYQYKNKLLSSIAGICDSVPTRMKQFEGQGIWVYNNNHFFRVKNGTCTPVPLPAALAGPIKLMDYYPDSGNRLWITCNKGLVCAGPQSYRFYGVNEGLSSELTSVICLDREGNIWAGTSEAGLNKMKHKTFFTYSRKDGLFADPTGALLLLKNKSLLVSNYCEGLNKIDQEGIRPFMKEHMGCIWALMKDKDSALWLGVYGDGVFRYHQEKWTHYTAAKDSLSGNIVFSLFQDSQGTVWIGTNNGICTWTNGHITPVLKTRITSPVTHILEDHLHRIWYGSSDGLGMISANNLTVYTTASGLSHNKVRYVYEDQEGIFWIATYGGGINRLKDGKLFSFHTLPGMIDEYTSAIQEDDSGNLWISSNRGIYKALKKDLNNYADALTPYFSTTYYGLEEGLKNSECNGGFQPSVQKSPTGQIWFPTLVGVVMTETRHSPETSPVPEVFLEQILADDKPIPFKNSTAEIRTDNRKIAFHYTAPFFGGDHKLFFQSMLEGKDKEWSPPTESRTAEYTDLQPGTYTFHIRVYGTTAYPEKQVSLILPFPFWRTWTFYICLYAGSGLLLFLYLRYRFRRIQKREAEKNNLARAYAELELKALQGQMNPHFTFNCLNTIKYFIATDNKVSANKYLGKFSRLLRLFLEQSTSSYISLASELEILSLYVELEQLRTDKEFEFHLEVSDALDTAHIDIPAMLLQPFMENAIHHGLLNSDRKRMLYLRIRKEGDMLTMEVEDNGIGRARSAALRCTPSSIHKSMGIQNTTDRISTINYIKNTVIEMRVTDLTDNAGEGSGTRVSIHIPFHPNLHQK